jgi:hypothetical protein
MLFDPSNPDAFWLDVTNAALGVFCFVCIAAIGWGVWQDLSVRWRRRSIHVLRSDPHSHFDPMLGPSMADGGDPVDRSTNGDEPQIEKQERDT